MYSTVFSARLTKSPTISLRLPLPLITIHSDLWSCLWKMFKSLIKWPETERKRDEKLLSLFNYRWLCHTEKEKKQSRVLLQMNHANNDNRIFIILMASTSNRQESPAADMKYIWILKMGRGGKWKMDHVKYKSLGKINRAESSLTRRLLWTLGNIVWKFIEKLILSL